MMYPMTMFTAINQPNTTLKEAMITIERNQLFRYYNLLLSTGNRQLLDQFVVKHEENEALQKQIDLLVLRYTIYMLNKAQYLDWIKAAMQDACVLNNLIILEAAIDLAIDHNLFVLAKMLLMSVQTKDKYRFCIKMLKKKYKKSVIHKFSRSKCHE